MRGGKRYGKKKKKRGTNGRVGTKRTRTQHKDLTPPKRKKWGKWLLR